MSKKKVSEKPSPPLKPYAVEVVPIESLRPHPKNYRIHPADELEHIAESLRRFGVYRNVVIAKDGTLLAGHGVVTAAKQIQFTKIPVIRLNVDPDSPEALKVLVGDNEIEHLSEQDDRLLAGLLKIIKEQDPMGLRGTGYDEMMLSNFLMVTRPASEIADFDAAAAWTGMPEYQSAKEVIKIVIAFDSAKRRDEFVKKFGIEIDYKREKNTWSTKWPYEGREDRASLKFKK